MKLIISAFALLSFLGCGTDPAPEPTVDQPEVQAQEAEPLVTAQPNAKTLQVHGILVVPPTHEATVHPMFAGYVHSIKLLPGERVKKGQVIFELTHPGYIEKQKNFLSAQALFSQQDQEWKRQSQLHLEKIISDKDAAAAKNEWAQAQAAFLAAQAEMALMGIDLSVLNRGQISPTLVVRAPIDGYITEVSAHQGMFLSENQAAMTITDLREMHLELEVFEYDVALVRPGQSVSFYFQDRPDQVYKAEVHLVNKAVDAQTRTLVVYADIDQALQGSLTPGMFVAAQIAID